MKLSRIKMLFAKPSNAVSYDIEPNVSVVSKNKDGLITTGIIYLSAYKNEDGERTIIALAPSSSTVSHFVQYSIDGGAWTTCANIRVSESVTVYGVHGSIVATITSGITFRLCHGTSTDYDVLKTIGTLPVVKDGDEGKGYKAVVYRDNFSTADWDYYGTIGHNEPWGYERVYANGTNNNNPTSEIRNGSVTGDIFLIVGNATDTNVYHELTYRCNNDSGNLNGVCVAHRLTGSNPNLLKRTVFDRGIDFVKGAWTASGGNWSPISIDNSTDKMVDGKKSILIDATSLNSYSDIIQNVIARVKPSTWYTFSFYAISDANWTSYIYSTTSSPCIDRSVGIYADGVHNAYPGSDGAKYWAADSVAKRHTLTFKTASSFPTAYVEIRIRCWAGSTLNLCMPKLEIGMNATPYVPNDEDLIGGVSYSFIFTEAYARLTNSNVVEGNLEGYAYKRIGDGEKIALANTTIRYGYILDDSQTYYEESTDANGHFDTQEWFTGDEYTDPGVKSSPSIFAAIIIDGAVVHVEHFNIVKEGKNTPWYYYDGAFDSTKEYTGTLKNAPWVSLDVTENGVTTTYGYMLIASTNLVDGSLVAPRTAAAAGVWELMTSSFKWLITEAVFAAFAKFGGLIIKDNYMISQLGIDGTTNYQNFTRESGSWKPMLLINAATGAGWLAGGNIRFNTDGSGSIAGGKISWNSRGLNVQGKIHANLMYADTKEISASYTVNPSTEPYYCYFVQAMVDVELVITLPNATTYDGLELRFYSNVVSRWSAVGRLYYSGGIVMKGTENVLAISGQKVELEANSFVTVKAMRGVWYVVEGDVEIVT